MHYAKLKQNKAVIHSAKIFENILPSSLDSCRKKKEKRRKKRIVLFHKRNYPEKYGVKDWN